MAQGVHPRPGQKASPAMPELLEFAREVDEADLTETTGAHRDDGWVVEKPSYKFWNYVWQRLWLWMLRLTGSAFHVQVCDRRVTIGGTVDAGDQRRITVDGSNVDYTTAAGDATNSDIATNFAKAINADPTVSAIVFATANGAVIELRGIQRATDFTLAVSILVDVGVVDATITTATFKTAPYAVSLDSDDPIDVLDFVVGSHSLDDTGNLDHDKRVIFDKSNGFFGAGEWQTTEVDSGSRGANAICIGGTNGSAAGASAVSLGGGAAPGDSGVAIGPASQAQLEDSIAIGELANASGLESTAIGDSAGASATRALALGKLSTASALDAVAIGSNTVATAADAVAIGDLASATASQAVAAGYNADAQALRAVAIGMDSIASQTDAVAIGVKTTSSGKGSVALGGDATQDNTASGDGAVAAGLGTEASGAGAVALGRGDVAGVFNPTASGDGSFAHSAGVASTEQAQAAGDHAYAHGVGVAANQPLSRAHGEFTTALVEGHHVMSGGTFKTGVSRFAGDGQTGRIPLAAVTVGAVTVIVGQDPQTVPAAVTFPIDDNRLVMIRGDICAIADDGAGGLDVANYSISALIENDAGVVTVKSGGITTDFEDIAGWGLALVAVAGATDGFRLDATGVAGQTIWWQGNLSVTEVAEPY